MSHEFKYKPLTEPDEMRLIELQPSSDPSAAVRCSLIHKVLSSCDIRDIFSNYVALSYVWGCEQKIKTIWIDGTPLKVTANLFSALHDLRDDTRTFLLWADGICINQSDNEEKKMQIHMMEQIYAAASITIVYLGHAESESNECCLLAALRQGRHLANGDMEVLLYSVFSKDWFSRVWVFQELVFSVNPWLQFGKTRVKWEQVHSAMRERPYSPLHSPQNQKYRIASEMQHAWESHHNSGRRNSMFELLQARRGLGISDPRDMVFAHVGFAADGQHEDLEVNYSKTCVQVYTDFARYLGKNYGIGIPTLLKHVGDTKSPLRLKDLPSWVPDWTTPLSATQFPMRVYNSREEHLIWCGS